MLPENETAWLTQGKLNTGVSTYVIFFIRTIYAQQGKGPSPLVVERFQSVASQLMNQRIIRLGGAVDDDSCNLIVAQLLWLDANDPDKDITLYVNSPGGSVHGRGWQYLTPCDIFAQMFQLSVLVLQLPWVRSFSLQAHKESVSVYRIVGS